jgi:hypothetical protein
VCAALSTEQKVGAAIQPYVNHARRVRPAWPHGDQHARGASQVLAPSTCSRPHSEPLHERAPGKLLIRGFGVRVPGGAPVLSCGNSLLRPTIMAWRGTNSIRRFDAQDDHSAQPLLTHSDRTASSTGAMPVRPTEPVPPNRVAIVTGLGGGICRYICDTVGLTSPERLAASPVGTVDAPTRPPGRRRHP